MKRPTILAFPLFSLMALLVTGPLALAAKPPVPVPVPDASEVPQRSGTIEFVDLTKGLIVINDREYVLSNKLTFNGKSEGARYSLRKGMHVNFTYMSDRGLLVINDIRTGQ